MGEVVPLEHCPLCEGSGFVDPFVARATVSTFVDGFEVTLVKTQALGMLWFCECPAFHAGASKPPFCRHSVEAWKRVQRLKGSAP